MESCGNGGDNLDESMEESEEYRLLEAYCATRRQQTQRSPMFQYSVNAKKQDHAPLKLKAGLKFLMVDSSEVSGKLFHQKISRIYQ